MNTAKTPKRLLLGTGLKLVRVSWRDVWILVLPIMALSLGAAWLVIKFVRPAPPNRIRLLSGPEGSTFRRHAERYKKSIEAHGVKVELLNSRGADENLDQLRDPKAHVDVGLVQSGLFEEGEDTKGLVSLGSLFPQPLMVYHRLPNPSTIERLTQLSGKRIAVGPEGSGTRALAMKLLALNEVDKASTVFVALGGADAAKALLAGEVDAAFLTSDTATREVFRQLRAAPGVELMNFRQAGGYARRLRYLSRLKLPEGALDIAQNDPPHDYDLVATTVEMIARPDLHPALSDLLISAAREVHSPPSVFREAGEYPSPQAHDFPLSEDAERYYKTGAKLLYKSLPFWLASLLDRLVVVVVPLLVIIVPATRIVPSLYRWRIRSRIYRWYGVLLAIERELLGKPTQEQRLGLLQRLDEIEDAVNEVKTPLSFADQLYVLREHVTLVRHRLESPGHAERGQHLSAKA
ncbi:MAG: TAXI family TRAP transporter solute-binding subunit [Deltaproteobacteria bacterium]|nr:TAXI family TRAP transporter solute-binding subunit [Deltaproteobacteria bacterium]